MHFSGEVSPDPNPRVLDNDVADVRAAIADGLQVYAFEGATQWLNAQGFDFERTTIARQPFGPWLATQRRGTVFIAAAAGRALPFDWLPPSARSQRPSNYTVMIHVAGSPDTVIEQSDANVALARPAPDGRTLSVTASDDGPQIVIGDDVLASVDRGLAVAALTSDGRVLGRWVFDVDETPALELPPYAFVLRDSKTACVTLRPGQATDVTGIVAGGGWLATLEGSGKGSIALDLPAPPTTWRHWLSHGRGDAGIEQSSLTFDGYQGTRPVFNLIVPPEPGHATATLQSTAVTAATVCGTNVPGLPAAGALDVGADHDGWFGAGWHLGERGGTQRFRWSSRASTMRWVMERPQPLRLVLRMRAAHAKGATIQAAINGHTVPGCTLTPGEWTSCRIDLPESDLQTGINQLTLTSDSVAPADSHPGDARELAFVLQPSRIRAQ
jgi:hypothetical protein